MAATGLPQLPPRTYPRSPLALYLAPAVARPVPSYERYRVLLRFFRRLSYLLTVSGSATAVLVSLWRTYFLPRWTETNTARAKAAAHQHDAYEALLPRLRHAARRGGGLAVRVEPKRDESAEEESKEAGEAEAGTQAEGSRRTPLQIKAVAEEDEEEILDLDEPAPAPVAAPIIKSGEDKDGAAPPSSEAQPPRSPRLEPLDTARLVHVDEYGKRGVQLANRNALPASSKAASALITSLSSFNADINAQAFLAGSESTRPPLFPLGSTPSSAGKAAGSDLAQIKAEIRSLKGVLLSRRNFGYARPTAPVVQ